MAKQRLEHSQNSNSVQLQIDGMHANGQTNVSGSQNGNAPTIACISTNRDLIKVPNDNAEMALTIASLFTVILTSRSATENKEDTRVNQTPLQQMILQLQIKHLHHELRKAKMATTAMSNQTEFTIQHVIFVGIPMTSQCSNILGYQWIHQVLRHRKLLLTRTRTGITGKVQCYPKQLWGLKKRHLIGMTR